MAEQIDPATGKPRRKRKGDRPEDPQYPMLPDAPEEQQPPASVNEMFNPTPQNPQGQTPEQQAVPATDAQYLNMTPDQRTQENLRRRGMSPEETSQFNEGVANREPLQVRRQQPDMNMPPAPQQLPMSPAAGVPQPQPEMVGPQEIAGPQPMLPMSPGSPAAPRQIPTNQFGQPVRGVLIPERAPEDPNRVMEEFGRGSPEHIEALQAQMRTQQVARSRTEDMADPRLAHLPTAEQYQSDLTRRRYGEEAIDKRAGQLMGEAPFRTEAEAVRLAGREALDQRRRDRGLPTFQEKAEQRKAIRARQQEMSEERRDTRLGERKARRQEDIDRRTAAEMGIPYGEYLQQKEAMDLERFKAETERNVAMGAISAQRDATTTGAKTEVDVATLKADAQKAITGMSNEDREAARVHLGNMKTEEYAFLREKLQQDGRLQENAQLLSQAQSNAEFELRVREMAPRFNPMEMVAIAEQHASNMGLDLDTVGIQVMNAYNNAQMFGQQQRGDSEQRAPQIDVVQRTPPTTGVGEPNVVPTEPEQGQPGGSVPRPRRSEQTEPAKRDFSQDIGQSVVEWNEVTNNIPNTLFGMFGLDEAKVPSMKLNFKKMDKTAAQFRQMADEDPEGASELAAELLSSLADSGWTSEAPSTSLMAALPTGGITAEFFRGMNTEERFVAAKEAYAKMLMDFASGNFTDSPEWDASLKSLEISRERRGQR